MIRNLFERNRRAVNQVSTFIIVVILVFVFFRYFLFLFAPFLVGWIISMILSKPVRFLNKKTRIPRSLAGILCLVLFLVLLFFAGNAIVGQIFNQIDSFRMMLPTYSVELMAFADSIRNWFASLSDILPDYVMTAVDSSFSSLLSGLTSTLGSLFKNSSISVVSSLPNMLIFVIVTIVATIFFIRDKELIAIFISRQFPQSWKNTFSIIRRSLFKFIGGYLKAEIMVAGACFCVVFAGLLILGYQYALLVALLIAVVDFLPILGSGFVLWPWIAFSIFDTDYKYAIGLGIIYICVQISRQTLEPRLVGHNVGLHPLVTLMAMFAGLKAFGIIGLAIFPIMVITIKTLQQEDLLPRWK